MRKVLTLAFLLKDNHICLAMKKRGFGEGETVWETVARGCKQKLSDCTRVMYESELS